jgi:hypothetical protein
MGNETELDYTAHVVRKPSQPETASTTNATP